MGSFSNKLDDRRGTSRGRRSSAPMAPIAPRSTRELLRMAVGRYGRRQGVRRAGLGSRNGCPSRLQELAERMVTGVRLLWMPSVEHACRSNWRSPRVPSPGRARRPRRRLNDGSFNEHCGAARSPSRRISSFLSVRRPGCTDRPVRGGLREVIVGPGQMLPRGAFGRRRTGLAVSFGNWRDRARSRRAALGHVRVVPPWTCPALRRLQGSYQEVRTGTISRIKVSTVSGEPR